MVPLGGVEIALQLQQGAPVGVGPGAQALGGIAEAVNQGIGGNGQVISLRTGVACQQGIEQGEGLAITALLVQHLGQLQPGGAMARRLLQQLAVTPLRLRPGAGFLQGPGRAEQLLQLRRRTEGWWAEFGWARGGGRDRGDGWAGDGRAGGWRAGGGGASCVGDGLASFARFASLVSINPRDSRDSLAPFAPLASLAYISRLASLFSIALFAPFA